MRTTRRKLMTVVAVALVVAGAAFILYPMSTDLRYEFAQWRLSEAVAAETGTAGDEGQPMPAGAVARLLVPSLGIDAYVLEGTTPDVLNQGPGHYPETPLPGETGNAAIAGHRTMYGQVFHDLHLLVEGDTIQTHTADRSVTFEVVEITIVSPGETDVVADTDDTRLTLTTCHPIGSAAQRLVVVAIATD